jgi:hypothetical protein
VNGWARERKHFGEVANDIVAGSVHAAQFLFIGLRTVPDSAHFGDRPGGYIYCRYQRTDDPSLDESLFPVLADHRAEWIEHYLRKWPTRSDAKILISAPRYAARGSIPLSDQRWRTPSL